MPLHKVRSDGTDLKKLTDGKGFSWMPCWSPAFNEIVYESLANNREIFTMRPDGTNVRNLTRNAVTDHAPACSPDGRHIALISGKFGNAEVCVMNVNGYDMRNLTHHPGRDSEPTWSPDGSWLAFTRSHNGGPMNIFIMRSDGSGQLNITNSQVSDHWSASWRKQGSDQTR